MGTLCLASQVDDLALDHLAAVAELGLPGVQLGVLLGIDGIDFPGQPVVLPGDVGELGAPGFGDLHAIVGSAPAEEVHQALGTVAFENVEGVGALLAGEGGDQGLVVGESVPFLEVTPGVLGEVGTQDLGFEGIETAEEGGEGIVELAELAEGDS